MSDLSYLQTVHADIVKRHDLDPGISQATALAVYLVELHAPHEFAAAVWKSRSKVEEEAPKLMQLVSDPETESDVIEVVASSHIRGYSPRAAAELGKAVIAAKNVTPTALTAIAKKLERYAYGLSYQEQDDYKGDPRNHRNDKYRLDVAKTLVQSPKASPTVLALVIADIDKTRDGRIISQEAYLTEISAIVTSVVEHPNAGLEPNTLCKAMEIRQTARSTLERMATPVKPPARIPYQAHALAT